MKRAAAIAVVILLGACSNGDQPEAADNNDSAPAAEQSVAPTVEDAPARPEDVAAQQAYLDSADARTDRARQAAMASYEDCIASARTLEPKARQTVEKACASRKTAR